MSNNDGYKVNKPEAMYHSHFTKENEATIKEGVSLQKTKKSAVVEGSDGSLPGTGFKLCSILKKYSNILKIYTRQFTAVFVTYQLLY